MEINIESLIKIIVKEVIAELSKSGIKIKYAEENILGSKMKKQHKVNMNGFKTPVLTENSFDLIDPAVEEIIIPEGTVLTPGAREIIKKRNYLLVTIN